MTQYAKLKLEAIAIGSLPHKNINSAMNMVKKDFINLSEELAQRAMD